MTEIIELEKKFVLPEDRLDDILGFVQISRRNGDQSVEVYDIVHHDEYFDTEDFDFANNGASYRHRTISASIENGFFIMFKRNVNGDDITERIELSHFVNKGNYLVGVTVSDYLTADFKPVSEARKITGTKNIKQIFDIINRRRRITFENRDYKLEVGIDNLTYISRDLIIIPDFGVEVELIKGDRKILNQFSEQFAASYGLVEERESKYLKGLHRFGFIQ